MQRYWCNCLVQQTYGLLRKDRALARPDLMFRSANFLWRMVIFVVALQVNISLRRVLYAGLPGNCFILINVVVIQ